MPPLIVAAGAVMAGLMAYRAVKEIVLKVTEDLDAVRESDKPLEGTRLVRDPVSGEYRPEKTRH